MLLFWNRASPNLPADLLRATCRRGCEHACQRRYASRLLQQQSVRQSDSLTASQFAYPRRHPHNFLAWCKCDTKVHHLDFLLTFFFCCCFFGGCGEWNSEEARACETSYPNERIKKIEEEEMDAGNHVLIWRVLFFYLAPVGLTGAQFFPGEVMTPSPSLLWLSYMIMMIFAGWFLKLMSLILHC